MKEEEIFLKRARALITAGKRAKNVEFKNLWFNKLKELMYNEQRRISGEDDSGTIH
jgi:hypothetical protein